ncbi:hypothetical protein AVEN_257612-1 [Araneus ventricosus]|uniref:Uncharacterized protein n=1 Tax=Araneus ventricosus TaxID=182803 RepID=A0A4Y2E756_ARAVE|nr:hypothetical protein AVEN_257612-1 [Araneus ventricosus]
MFAVDAAIVESVCKAIRKDTFMSIADNELQFAKKSGERAKVISQLVGTQMVKFRLLNAECFTGKRVYSRTPAGLGDVTFSALNDKCDSRTRFSNRLGSRSVEKRTPISRQLCTWRKRYSLARSVVSISELIKFSFKMEAAKTLIVF